MRQIYYLSFTPQKCFQNNYTDNNVLEVHTIKPCIDKVIEIFETYLVWFWVAWGIVLTLETFQIFASFILLATRLPYNKNKLKNNKLMDLGIEKRNWLY